MNTLKTILIMIPMVCYASELKLPGSFNIHKKIETNKDQYQNALNNMHSILNTLAPIDQKRLLLEVQTPVEQFEGLEALSHFDISAKDIFGSAKKGGSSTGGGSDRVEKFKAYAHMYATHLQSITNEQRSKYGISTTSEQLRRAIVKLSDNIYELKESDNFEIYNEFGEVIASVKSGRIYESGNPKDAYYGISKDFKSAQLSIFLSRDWSDKEYTLSLKEFLRSIGNEDETSSILDHLSHIKMQKIALNIGKKPYKDYSVTLEEDIQIRNVSIKKTSECTKYISNHARAKERKKLTKELRACSISNAVSYAARMCESSYETVSFWKSDYKYAKMANFEIIDEECRSFDNEITCKKDWEVTCAYYYKSSNK